MSHRFSRRLDWTVAENALSALEARMRCGAGIPFDLAGSNPTIVGLPDEGLALGRAFGRPEIACYTPAPGGSLDCRQRITETYAGKGLHIPPERLILTTSSSESYSYLFKLLGDPGDVVLVPEPSYPLFDSLARLEGLVTMPYRLEQVGHGLWRIDLDSVDDALARASTRVRALTVVTPNHPTGSVLVDEQLDALDARCAEAGIAIISDEVFADFISHPRAEHVRCVAGAATRSLTFSLGGLSKSCGLPQLKLGWIALGGPSPSWAEARRRLEWIADTFLPVAAPIEIALTAVLSIGARRRTAITARLAENRLALDAGLAGCFGTASPVTVLPSEGGWSVVLRLPAILDDEAWALDLLEHAGVLVHPGYFFDLRGTHIVLSLLPEPGTFAAGIDRLAARVRHLNGTESPTGSAPPRPL